MPFSIICSIIYIISSLFITIYYPYYVNAATIVKEDNTNDIMQNNIIDDVNKIDETYLHIADKNVPYDQNRPDFGHDHNFVTADMYIYSHWRKSHTHEGGCEKNEVNVGGCILGGFDGNGRNDEHHKFLCDYDTKEIYVSHCRKEDCTHCTEPVINHYGYEHDKCRFGYRKIKCTTKPWHGCVRGHSKHTLPEYVCGDREKERMHDAEDDHIIEKPAHREHHHKYNIYHQHHTTDVLYSRHPNEDL